MITEATHTEVRRRIKELEGETFHQLRGKPFTYTLQGETLMLSHTNQGLPPKQVREALQMMPVKQPSDLSAFRGQSSLYAILMDPRVRQGLY